MTVTEGTNAAAVGAFAVVSIVERRVLATITRRRASGSRRLGSVAVVSFTLRTGESFPQMNGGDRSAYDGGGDQGNIRNVLEDEPCFAGRVLALLCQVACGIPDFIQFRAGYPPSHMLAPIVPCH